MWSPKLDLTTESESSDDRTASGAGQKTDAGDEFDPGVFRLNRRFSDRVAVAKVSLWIGPGETYGLLGPNGAGKTTTIRMVRGLLLTPDTGSVAVAWRRYTYPGLRGQELIGYVPQDVALYPDLTARDAAETIRAHPVRHG